MKPQICTMTTSSGGTSTHVVKGVPRDRYSFLAQCTDGRAGILDDVLVEPRGEFSGESGGETGGEPLEVELAVRPAARLRVFHRGATAFVTYRVLRDGRTVGLGVLSAGQERVDFLPPGAYELVFEPGEGEPVRVGVLAQLGIETAVRDPPE